MKFYKSVIEKAEQTNYKKGIVRLDTKSGYYTAGKTVYYIAFVWFMFFQFAYLFSNTMALLFYKKAAENIHMELYTAFWVSFVLMWAGFVFIKVKWHVAALVSNLAAAFSLITTLNTNEMVSLAFLEGGFLNNKYFWFHYAPSGLIAILTLVIAVIGIKTYIHFRQDYKKALASMFEDYLACNNPNASDTEWKQYLEELDAKKKETENTAKNKKREK